MDISPAEEQIIITRLINSPEPDLQILLASTTTDQDSYNVVWQENLDSVFLSNITLRTIDMTGSGKLDIIVSGFTRNGEYYTEIFATPSGNLASYQSIFKLQVPGNIDLLTSERPEDYIDFPDSILPFPVIVQQTDPDSDNELDIMEDKWDWDRNSFTYVQSQSRLIKAESILEKRIRAIYTGNMVQYEDYLQGLWYRESPGGNGFQYLYFEPATREIVFSNGEIQEIFNWSRSIRTTAKRIYTSVSNAIMLSNTDNVSVTAESWDSISISRSDLTWNGLYKRVGTTISGPQNDLKSLISLQNALPLQGTWFSSGEVSIIIDKPQFRWFDGEMERPGLMSIFSLGKNTILQVQFMKKNGAFEEVKNWLLEYSVDSDDSSKIVRSLWLTPVSLDINSITPTDEDPVRFEQIEIVIPDKS